MDASALVELLFRTAAGRIVEGRCRDAVLHSPALCDLEVAAALRRAWLSRKIDENRFDEALGDYLSIPITRHAHEPLLARILSLRHNFTVYDAAYVTLAERLDAELVTADGPLARAVRAHLKLSIVYAE